MNNFSLNRKARRAAKITRAMIDQAGTNGIEQITADPNAVRMMRNSAAHGSLTQYWLDGCIAVQIVPAVGPDKGIPILSFTPRTSLEDWIQRVNLVRIISEPVGTGEAGLVGIEAIDGSAVCRLIKRALLNPALQNQDFLDDIAILGALWLTKGNSALDGSGVGEIGLRISPNEDLPWHQRGMLAPDFAARFITPKLKVGSAPPATPSPI